LPIYIHQLLKNPLLEKVEQNPEQTQSNLCAILFKQSRNNLAKSSAGFAPLFLKVDLLHFHTELQKADGEKLN
jgi:hypothetical protein